MTDRVRLVKPVQMSAVCRTCTKWRRAEALGLEKCLSIDNCGSPIVLDTFHEYEGPIKDFLGLCFACGAKPTKALRVRGHVRAIGVCDQHVHYVAQLAPADAPIPTIPVPVILNSGGQETLANVRPEKKKTRDLGTMLSELDAGTFEPDK